MVRTTLAYILYAGGAATLVIALLHLAFGVASIPGAGYANATMESEDRFYAVIFGGYGVALLYCARDVVARAQLIRLLSGLFFAGALGRIISWVDKGPPHMFFVAMLVLELGLPFAIWGLQSQIARELTRPLRRPRTLQPPTY